MAPLPHVIWRPKATTLCMCLDSLQQFNNHIDDRSEFTDKKPMKRHNTWLYFDSIFRPFWRPLMAATITQNHLMMAEKDSVTQSTTEMT